MATYTILPGDIILCDINSTLPSPYTTLTYTTGFNFAKDADLQKQLDKTIYVIRKPGIPVGYEIGLGERIFSVTSTIKSPTTVLNNLYDLNNLCNNQYNTVVTATSSPSYGALKFYYYGDRVQNSLYTVLVKSMWYEQKPGRGGMFDIRISLTEVTMPGS